MSAPQPHTEPTQVPQDEIATGLLHEQPSRELSDAPERPRRGPAFSGRRLAVAAAVAVGVASGCAGIVTASAHTAQSTAREVSTGTSAQVLSVADAFGSSQHQIRDLEARGYVDVACAIHGELLFNPHTHHYVTIKA